MKKTLKIAKALNFLFCFGLVVILMTLAYKQWSAHGEYTIASFVCSACIHGGWGVVVWWLINNCLNFFFGDREEENEDEVQD